MIGTTVGSYRIAEKIGEGGMGAVFRGIDEMLEREVAIKMLRPELTSQPHVVERFRSEAVTLAKLNHPNIATLYSFLRQGEHFFMVMEFVKGETLDDVIRKYGAMPVPRAIELFCHALEGIEHAHKMGIIHRDIKPANLMLSQEGTIKVMDFGIARVLGTARLTRQGSVVGTIEYMSPEQVQGEEGDARSDIYSLGILFYEMLTGRVPFHSTSEFALMKAQIEEAPPPPRMFAPHIPVAVEQAIMRALAKKPDARYQSAGEFRASVLRSQAGATTGPKSAYAVQQPRTSEPRPSGPTPSLTQQGTLPLAAMPSSTKSDGAPSHPTASSQVKETVLGGAAVVSPVIQKETRLPSHQPFATNPEQHFHQQQHQVSIFQRLNWKHYTAIGAALLILLIAPFAIIAGLNARNQSVAPPLPPSQEEQTEQAAEPPAPPAENQVAPLPSDTPVSEIPVEGSSKTPRPRDSKGVGYNQPSDSTAVAPPPVAPPPTQPPPPAKSEPVAGNKEEPKKEEAKKEESRKEEAKKEEEKKEKKKSGGVGGFFKKVFGGGDKEEKKKKP
jgi:serine/threonine-protein kinase